MELYKRFKTVDGRQVPDGINWWMDMVNPATGRRLRRSTGKRIKSEALVTAKLFRAGLERTADHAVLKPKDGPADITLGDCLAAYVKSLQGASKASAEGAAALARKTLGQSGAQEGWASLEADMMLADLTTQMCAALVADRLRRGNSPQTAAHEMKQLRAATRYAAGLGFRVPEAMIDGTRTNPWHIPPLTEKTRYLSVEEWRTLYDYVGNWQLRGLPGEHPREVQDLLVALTMTGARWSEITSLRWDQVDCREFKSIRIWGNKDQQYRLVPIPKLLADVLKRRMTGWTGGALVFPGKDGKERPIGSCKPLLHAMDRCGFNSPTLVRRHGRATVHSLRHTFASWLLQGGADLSEVQDALGHATLNMTRRYAHLSKGKTAERLGNLLSDMTQE